MSRIGITMGIAALMVCPPVFAATGKAVIHGTQEGSIVSGMAELTDTPQGLAMIVSVADVPPGQHGIHIHEHGDCGDIGKAAGGHYNPENVPHGYLPKDGFAGAHAGDFGNLTVGDDGTGKLSITIPGLTLHTGTHTVAGRAVVLHERVDDFSQPTGNAGGRIGCGVIEVANP